MANKESSPRVYQAPRLIESIRWQGLAEFGDGPRQYEGVPIDRSALGHIGQTVIDSVSALLAFVARRDIIPCEIVMLLVAGMEADVVGFFVKNARVAQLAEQWSEHPHGKVSVDRGDVAALADVVRVLGGHLEGLISTIPPEDYDALARPLLPLLPTTLEATRPIAHRTRPLPPVLKHDSSNIYRSVMYALSHASQWKALGDLAYGIEQQHSDTQIVIGVPEGSHAETIWDFLRRGGVQAVKANCALWARWYAEDGEARRYITIEIAQFCADIGYKPHVRGGIRPEQKREAAKLLKALTSVEMRAYFTNPKTKRPSRLSGPLWARGLMHEEYDGYEDLFGATREGAPDLWEPKEFCYGPGPYFEHEEWRRFGHYLGKISVGLLQLSNDSDQWAILIGGYLSTLIRTNAYKPTALRIRTILERCDLAQSEDARRRRSVFEGRFYDALEKLIHVGVIKAYETRGFDASDVDMDDPDALAAYGVTDPAARKDWRSQVVLVTFPHEKDMERLAAAKTKAVTAAKRKRGRPRKNAVAEA